MAIVVNLEEQLKFHQMTSRQLCEKVGITEANMSILRSGKAKGVRFSTLNRICLHLQCDVGDILHFDGKEENNEETDIAVD
jgi:putative transcriptional regulator